MPVRSVNLKLVVPRTGDLAAARALWCTHEEVNRAVAHYERILLACRQAPYRLRDAEETSEGQVTAAALDLVDAARSMNGYAGTVPREEALSLLRRYYDARIPSGEGASGDAQTAANDLSPLCDATSKGHVGIFEKIGAELSWLEGVANGEVESFAEAERWLESPEGQSRLRATGGPTRWQKLAQKKDPSWPTEFLADRARKIKESEGIPALMRQMREAGILPLFRPYFGPRVKGSRGAVSVWDRLAFRLAIGHLLSWESWCKRAADDHRKRKEALATFRAERLVGQMVHHVIALQDYERLRTLKLQTVTGLDAKVTKITGRTIRGWGDLFEKWKGISDPAELQRRSASVQTRLKGRFGDPDLFAWLAAPENHALWADGPDALAAIARLNSLELLLARSRETATMTMAEAQFHPRAAEWEPPGGTHLRKFRLTGADRHLHIVLPLLQQGDGDELVEADFPFDLAPSDQLADVVLGSAGKVSLAEFTTPTGERARTAIGSADLLFDRDFLATHTAGQLAGGHIGPVWLKLALDVAPLDPVGDPDPRRVPAELRHFQQALGQASKHADAIKPGFRVLAVDLGVRTLGTCSVFALTDVQPAAGRMFLPLGDLKLWAVHERSFQLRLPDEDVDAPRALLREEAWAQLNRLRRALAGFRALRSLVDTPADERAGRLAAMAERRREDDLSFEAALLDGLHAHLAAPETIWTQQVTLAMVQFRHTLGQHIRAWRQATRGRGRARFAGKSIWAITYFTKVRSFLMGWSLISEKREVTRQDRARWGSFGRRLLRHIDGIKEDRLKTGADLLVQAARGYQRDKAGKWAKAHAPCHLILFEDLSRYRMRTDRPRRENGQLMLWSHRGLRQEVEMQAALHAIRVTDTGAAFSSRFHALTHTPGIRAHPVSRADLSDPAFAERMARQEPPVDITRLHPGDLVPDEGGEIFVCRASHKGGVRRLHADINAAQNLQRRFWTRHADAFRLPCREVTDGTTRVWIPKEMGKRLAGALGSLGRLVPTGHESGSCEWQPLPPGKARKGPRGDAAKAAASSPEDLLEDDDATDEEIMEGTGQHTTFFRDPSGVIFPAHLWVPAKIFWSAVRNRTLAALKTLDHGHTPA
jgi:hypothetical protein